MKASEPIYLDYAASAPVLPQVQKRMAEVSKQTIGNPSSIHRLGREASGILESARETLAGIIHGKPSEIIFTSGGTEANNLAIKGLATAHAHKGMHLISSEIEHPSVLESLRWLETQNFNVTYLTPDSHGRISPDDLHSAITDKTILISIMWVNNELGTINPVHELGQIAHSHDILFYTDAIQAQWGSLESLTNKHIDALSLSGHKIGAPAGTGALWLRKGIALMPMFSGGFQESSHRPGTQNLVGIAGFEAALRHTAETKLTQYASMQAHWQFAAERLNRIPGVTINTHPEEHAPHILNFSVHGVDGEALFIRLDMDNICVSNGSACSSGAQSPSHVLSALGLDPKLVKASLRISWGPDITREILDRFFYVLESSIRELRNRS